MAAIREIETVPEKVDRLKQPLRITRESRRIEYIKMISPEAAMKRIFILLGIILMVGFLSGTGVDALEKSSIRVKVLFQVDEGMKTTVETLLKKELRALEGVILVDENADFEILVMAMEMSGTQGEKAGAAFSTVFLRPYSRSGIPELIARQCRDNQEIGPLRQKLERTQIYSDHFLQVGSSKEIEEICKEIAGYFKKDILEGYRMPSSNMKK
jgi:hypothetical protein